MKSSHCFGHINVVSRNRISIGSRRPVHPTRSVDSGPTISFHILSPDCSTELEKKLPPQRGEFIFFIFGRKPSRVVVTRLCLRLTCAPRIFIYLFVLVRAHARASLTEHVSHVGTGERGKTEQLWKKKLNIPIIFRSLSGTERNGKS